MLGLGTGLVYPTAIDSVIPYANLASVLFDGGSMYGEIPDSDVLTPLATGSGFAWSVWVRLPSATSQQRIISKSANSGSTGHEWMLTTDGASKPRLFIYFNGTVSGRIRFIIDTGLSANTWYHLAFSWDGVPDNTSSVTGWLDGAIKTHGSGATLGQLGSGTDTVTNDTTTVKIARAIGNYGNVYVDEVALFDEELNNTQVTNIYNSGTPIDLSSHSDLVGYWRMGENDSSPTISDLSGQGNDMTLINSASIDTSVYAG